MAFDGFGNYNPPAAPAFPAITGTTVGSAYYNTVINDLAVALSNCIARDGQSVVLNPIPFNGKRLTGVGSATNATDAINLGQADGRYTASGAVGLFTSAWAAVPAGTNMVRTSGYSGNGKGAAWYVRDGTATYSAQGTALRAAAITAGIAAATVDASLVATEGKFRKADASGQYWTLSTDQEVFSTMFGAVHNAVYTAANPYSSRWVGTDDRTAVQAMIDWGIYFGGNPSGYVTPAKFLIGGPLHIGYGESFHHYELKGRNFAFADGTGGDCFLVRNFVGQPAINIQGGRNISIDGIGSYGTHYKYFSDNGFAAVGATCPVDDTNLANWYEPAQQTALGRSVDHRYCPDAFITVDAYSGTRPGTSYADAVYPAWLGAASLTQWGKTLTSSVMIDANGGQHYGEINIVVTHPSGSDGNGDFVRMGRPSFSYCKRVMSISQTQSRSVMIDYGVGGVCGEIIVNNVHGLQNGGVQGNFRISCSQLIRVCSFGGTQTAGSITFQSGKFEGLYQLADLQGGNLENPVTFRGCTADFVLQGDGARPIPSFTITGATNALCVIDGGSYTNFPGLFVGQTRGSVVNGAMFDGTKFSAGAGTIAPYLAALSNATGQVLFLGGTVGPWHSQCISRNTTTGAIVPGPDAATTARSITNGIRDTGRNFGLPIHVDYGLGQANIGYTNPDVMVFNPYGRLRYEETQATVTKTGTNNVCTPTSSATKWEIAYTYAFGAANSELLAGSAGDILIDRTSGVIMVVRSFDGYLGTSTKATIAVALNGVVKVAGSYVPINAFSNTAGDMIAINCRRYIPELPLFGDFANASASVTNLASRDGSAVNAATIVAGDWLDVDTLSDNIITNGAGLRVNVFTNTTKTATMLGTATRTDTSKRLNRFIRMVANG